MVQYAQKECQDCHGLFPGYEMVRITEEELSTSVKKGRVERTQYGSHVSVGIGRPEVTTHITSHDLLICRQCMSRRRWKALARWVFVAVAATAIVLYVSGREDTKHSNVQLEQNISEPEASAADPYDMSAYQSQPDQQETAELENQTVGDSGVAANVALPAPSPQGRDIISSDSMPATMPTARDGQKPWVTMDDYPKAALNERREGEVNTRLTIGPEGRVRYCQVISSSGYKDLDNSACEMLLNRGDFNPAVDASGKPVEGIFVQRVVWKLPQQQQRNQRLEKVVGRVVDNLLGQ